MLGIPSIALAYYYFVVTETCTKELWPLILFPTLGIVTCLLLVWIRFSNPGIAPVPDDESWKRDHPRAHFKDLNERVPERLHGNGAKFVPGHGVYVEEFDHFCPWVGNIVGKTNMLPFNAFSMVACASFVVIMIVSLHLMSQCSEGATQNSPSQAFG